MFYVTYKKKFTKLKQFTFTSYSFCLLHGFYFVYKNNEFDKFMKCTAKCTAITVKGKMISFKLQIVQ